MNPGRTPLPIDQDLPGLMDRLAAGGTLVLSAPPGAGKTTRLPGALLDHGLAGPDGNVLVLEPRRVAARMAAERVAMERDGRLGGEVGYQVRFDSAVSARTRLVYMTSGVFLRRIQREPDLPGVSAVILDEFHERSVEMDLSLAFLRDVRETVRPDLQVVVMSATLQAGPVAAYLGEATAVEVEGRQYPVELRHRRQRLEGPVEEAAAAAFADLRTGGLRGSVLIFMPGAAAIRRTLGLIEPMPIAAGYELLPLHGDLPLEAQLRAVRRGRGPRVVAATNVAEASLTVDGVEAVIDSGQVRVSRLDPARGLNRLATERISQASAAQRAGRAGRQGPGVCLRLYTEDDLAGLIAQTQPEVQRIDLSGPLLEVLAWGCRHPGRFPWLDAPGEDAVGRALRLLELLGAVRGERDGSWSLTGTGKRMMRYPVHPRQARVLVEGEDRGCRAEAALMAALLSERDILLRTRAFSGGIEPERTQASSDLLVRCDLWGEARAARYHAQTVLAMGIDPAAARRVGQAALQLAQVGDGTRRERELPGRGGVRPHPWTGRLEEDLLICLAAGFPDRVVRAKALGSTEGWMVGRLRTRLDPASSVRGAPLYLALEARPEQDSDGPRVAVGMASAVRLEWLEELFPDRLEIREGARLLEGSGRVEGIRSVLFLDLPLEEKTTGRVDADQAAELLYELASRDPGAALDIDRESADLLDRIRWLASREPVPGLVEIDGDPGEEMLRQALRHLCRGKRSLEELRRADPAKALEMVLPWEARSHLDARAPARLPLPSGRMARVDYSAQAGPMLAAPLQEFFGTEAIPALRGGLEPVVLHLLAPNQRAVQVTRDLSSFWKTIYPQIRGELSRRYPRHAWPEDPLRARPVSRPVGRRNRS